MIYLESNWNKGPVGETTDCFDAMAARLSLALSRNKIDHAVCPFGPPPGASPGWILFIGYDKQVAGHARDARWAGWSTAWLQEVPRPDIVDVSFHFPARNRRGWGRSVLLTPPIDPADYHVADKDGSILVDHQSWFRDQTTRVAEIVRVASGGRRILRMQGHKGRHPPPTGPEEVLPHLPYAKWLEATNRVEWHIVTHYESWGYGIADSLARGTRVASFPKCVPRWFRENHDIRIFTNTWELEAILRSPSIDTQKLAALNQSKFGDWDEVARRIGEELMKGTVR